MAEAEFKDHSTAMDSEPNPGTSSVWTTTSGTTTTTITTSSTRMQQPQISVYSGSDRHAVQVIQQALHRPPSSAAQYLQQMYAAQQQHLMLYIAALQQHYLSSSQLQSLAAVQASLSSGRPSTSPTGSVTQQSSMSQTSINLSTSPTPAQLISRSQASSSTSGSITQKTMLLGSTSPTVKASQTQMYLRAQMFKMTEREEQRICIKFCVKLEHSSAETIRMIHKAFGDEAMSAAQIKVWHKRFKDGRESIESDPRSGRPAASRPPENVECVQAAVNKGAYLEGD